MVFQQLVQIYIKFQFLLLLVLKPDDNIFYELLVLVYEQNMVLRMEEVHIDSALFIDRIRNHHIDRFIQLIFQTLGYHLKIVIQSVKNVASVVSVYDIEEVLLKLNQVRSNEPHQIEIQIFEIFVFIIEDEQHIIENLDLVILHH